MIEQGEFMPQEHTPDDFDWVGAQSKCSAASMFARLQAGVKEDVQRRNGLLARDGRWTFEFQEDSGEFEVSRVVALGATGSTVAALVRFERAGRRIHVHGDDVDFTAARMVSTRSGSEPCRVSGRVGIPSGLSKRPQYSARRPDVSSPLEGRARFARAGAGSVRSTGQAGSPTLAVPLN
jgi:hypothetical protein